MGGRFVRAVVGAGVASWLAGAAAGQSLYQRVPRAASLPVDARSRAVAGQGPSADGLPSVAQVSLYAVLPPEPRTYRANDLVTIIISERTETEQSATLETEKEYNANGELSEWIDLLQLLELRLRSGDRSGVSPVPSLRLSLDKEFEGEGESETTHQVTSRVTARVVEVKPNNTLLLESRTSVVTNGEAQVILMSGTCRAEDITDRNTVQSNQMYDLSLSIEQSGEVRGATKKGLIPRVFDVLFSV